MYNKWLDKNSQNLTSSKGIIIWIERWAEVDVKNDPKPYGLFIC